MAKVLATVSGVALAPGVSKNGRLYTREAIAKAVVRAQARLADGSSPMTMLTYHEAGGGDDSTAIVGRLASLTLGENGEAQFTADIADTPHGRTIATLLDTSDGKPAFLRGVSIRGAWAGKVRKENTPDGPVETSSDLELDGLDYTRKPGVGAAAVHTFAWASGGATETAERVPITESVQEARVTAITEAAQAKTPDPPGTAYADPGYLADKKKRYPLGNPGQIRAAWTYINQKANAAQYTPAQLGRIKDKIKKAMGRIGAKVTAENWVIWPAEQVTEGAIAEYGGSPDSAGSFSVCASNGPVRVEVSSYCVDPADLDLVLRAAVDGACLALAAIDPDMDGDMDVPGADAEDTDGDAAAGTALADNGDGVDSIVTRIMAAIRGESAETPEDVLAEFRQDREAVNETAPEEDPAPDPAAADREGSEAPVTETTTTTEAAATAPASSLSTADVDAAVARALAAAKADRKAAKAAKRKPAESAPAAPVTETAQAPAEDVIARMVREGVAAALAAEGLTETVDQKVTRLVREGVTAAKQELTAQGRGPGRKGLAPAGAVTEAAAGSEPGLNSHGLPSNWPDKPLHAFTSEEMDQYAGPVLTRHVLGARADQLG